MKHRCGPRAQNSKTTTFNSERKKKFVPNYKIWKYEKRNTIHLKLGNFTKEDYQMIRILHSVECSKKGASVFSIM
jgi:hypothetical protein